MKNKRTQKQIKPRHPQYKARKILNLGNNDFIGWSIYPDQLKAMERAMLHALHRAAQQPLNWSMEWRIKTVRSLLKSIGLVPPNA